MKLKGRGRGSWHSKQGKEAINPIRCSSSSRFQNPELRNHSKPHSLIPGPRNPERKINSFIPVPVPGVSRSQSHLISEFLYGIICKILENLRDKNESLKISDFELIQIPNHESDLKSLEEKEKERERERERQSAREREEQRAERCF